MTMQLPTRLHRRVRIDLELAFARFIWSVNEEDRPDLLVRLALFVQSHHAGDSTDLLSEIALAVHSCCEGDERLFGDLLDTILAAADWRVALEIESRIWQSVGLATQGARITAGSEAWDLD